MKQAGCDNRSAAFEPGTSREASVTRSSRGRSARDAAGVWAFIAQGLSGEDAAMKVGISLSVGSRWFQTAGEMALILPVSGQGDSQLSVRTAQA